ncbi:HAD family hydrolase [Gracilibacillus oryzae]|uniref:HAD family hydrolase n=1 Tax=Gracilibacillus oryzae TaxID=1672701 RepID=A0A7C8GRQ5_9BACI|nr:HAD family hydrolase [Gracilibacillus oryzae]KAB8129381.1 HAD family hydrolase [Gracilibacillus oryzae]
MVKLFATDLDGTLLKKENVIKEEDIKAIKQLTSNGIDFAIATGRLDRDILRICKEIDFTAHRISQNGTFVQTRDNASIYAKTFDIPNSKAIHEKLITYQNPLCVSTNDELYISEISEEMKALENFLYFPLVEGIDFLDQYGETIHASKYMMIGQEQDLVTIESELRDHFAGHIETYLSDPRCLDIVPKGVSKAAGLHALANHLNIETEEIAVIGDAYIDIPMFEMTPYSFAMSTAPAPVQQKAAHVVNDVYEAIDHISDLVKS